MVVLLVSVYTRRPLDFAAFPTVLLVATLMRLALNVASTRVVLLYGHEGGAAAGHVIEAFGNVVIGGNYAVGQVVFCRCSLGVPYVVFSSQVLRRCFVRVFSVARCSSRGYT